MRLAKETRMAAWQCLRENDSYGKYLVALALLSLVCLGFAMVVTAVVLGGVFLMKPWFDKSSFAVEPEAFAKGPLALLQVAKNFLSQPPEVLMASLALGAVVAVIVFYMIGFGEWSSKAMSIASARRGLTSMHGFSGWGHGWSMMGLLLWRDTMVALGFCLLILPGVLWAFSYAMAPYLRVDHPDWSSWQCLRESERLMEGNRMRLFKLGFSFIGWYLLVLVVQRTIPLVGGLANYFLTPYPETAFALFYEELLDNSENPQGDLEVTHNEPERNPGNDEH